MILERITTALESIAASLVILAAGAGVEQVDTATGEPASGSRSRGRPRKDAPADAAKQTPAQAAPSVQQGAAAQAQQAATGTVTAAAKPADTTAGTDFDYEVLKGVVVELVNAGSEGKGAAINVLSKYGVKKASEAAPEKWQAMHADMSAELAKLKGDEDLS